MQQFEKNRRYLHLYGKRPAEKLQTIISFPSSLLTAAVHGGDVCQGSTIGRPRSGVASTGIPTMLGTICGEEARTRVKGLFVAEIPIIRVVRIYGTGLEPRNVMT